MNDYYDVSLKEACLQELLQQKSFVFIRGSIADKTLVESVFEQYHPQIVVHPAAQAGVRYSITDPEA